MDFRKAEKASSYHRGVTQTGLDCLSSKVDDACAVLPDKEAHWNLGIQGTNHTDVECCMTNLTTQTPVFRGQTGTMQHNVSGIWKMAPHKSRC